MKRLRNMIALLISALVLSMSFSSSVRDAQHPQVLLTRAYASVDASTAWNSVCANYEFPNTASVPSGYTFLQAWNMRMTHTQTFDDAFAGIQSQVSQILGTPIPDFGDGDNMSVSIQNWPSE